MKFGTAMLLVAAAGTVASADRIESSVNGLTLPAEIAAINALNTDRGVGYMEDFETFADGPLVPQGGWGSAFDANAFAVTTSPLSGNVSGRHTSDGSAFGGFEAFSPIFTPEFGSLSADILISGGGSLYQLATSGNSTGFLNTRVNFDLTGDITVGQVNAAQTAFEFIDSGADWTVGTAMNIGIGVDAGGALTVSLNGANIFTGTETSFDLTGVAGPIDQWLVFAANEGVGAPDGSGDTLTFDNVGIIPAPGAVALAGIAGLAGARRRRA